MKGLTKVSYGLLIMITESQQLCWMYQDWKRDDEYVYAVEYEQINGRSYIAGITKSVGRMQDYVCDDYEALEMRSVYDNCKYTLHDTTFGTVIDLMTTRARKTNRKRKSFNATEEWLKKLPLDEKVDL